MGFENVVVVFVVGVPAIAGLLGIAWGVRRRQRVRRLARDGQRIVAVVDGHERVVQDEGRDKFRPVVRFHTREGLSVRTALDGSPHYETHPVETPVEIVYDPADPHHASAVGNPGDGGMMSIVVGVVFLAIAVGASFFV
ncbi:DUF3592 domain-containing protein [Actinoplanes bogorensis]|uniref:DUF3592 domain-containing protein n=1 Tax=Paractinoplanes bogorensis TaxID=1610840 RepID=A0ABS5YXS1_9ACTN|nr:DUF3592 domain-containing protein [Actinoplanes bogorensis]MBU2667866.1 DUF3592 domain-containing protein [Actinoplanes bogorensis]